MTLADLPNFVTASSISTLHLQIDRLWHVKTLCVSREILTMVSPVFERMLSHDNGFLESTPGYKVKLPEDCVADFLELLYHVYPSYQKPITDANVERLAALADKYGMDGVLFECEQHILSENCGFSVVGQLKIADRFRFEFVKDKHLHRLKVQPALMEFYRLDRKFAELSDEMRLAMYAVHFGREFERAPSGRLFCPTRFDYSSTSREHCGGSASIVLCVGSGKDAKRLHVSREMLAHASAELGALLQEKIDMLILEGDDPDGWIHFLNLLNPNAIKSPITDETVESIATLAHRYRVRFLEKQCEKMLLKTERFTTVQKLQFVDRFQYRELRKICLRELHQSRANIKEAYTLHQDDWSKLSVELRVTITEEVLASFRKADWISGYVEATHVVSSFVFVALSLWVLIPLHCAGFIYKSIRQ